ncbi:MAG: hypothetical protein WBZ14_15995 [Terriglobales bacterium]|jgi:hypothetical protein
MSVKADLPKIELYLAVLPFVHLSVNFGLTEQVLTLFPNRDFATEFFPDEVDRYILTFEKRANEYLLGGHVIGYKFTKEETKDGRVVVRVTQSVR